MADDEDKDQEEPKIEGDSILVEALETGVYNHRRYREGDRFVLQGRMIKKMDKDLPWRMAKRMAKVVPLKAETQFSPMWMVKIDDKGNIIPPKDSDLARRYGKGRRFGKPEKPETSKEVLAKQNKKDKDVI